MKRLDKMWRKNAPLEGLHCAREITARDPDYAQKTETFLQELREDRQKFGDRTAT